MSTTKNVLATLLDLRLRTEKGVPIWIAINYDRVLRGVPAEPTETMQRFERDALTIPNDGMYPVEYARQLNSITVQSLPELVQQLPIWQLSEETNIVFNSSVAELIDAEARALGFLWYYNAERQEIACLSTGKP